MKEVELLKLIAKLKIIAQEQAEAASELDTMIKELEEQYRETMQTQ